MLLAVTCIHPSPWESQVGARARDATPHGCGITPLLFPENTDNSELRFYQFYFLDFLSFFFFLDHAGHMSVLGSAMVCQPEIQKANLATSQSPSKPFMSQGRFRGPTTSLWPFGQNLTPSPWIQRPSRVLPGWDASAELVVPVLVWQLARELGGLQHCSWLRKGRVFTLAQCCN